MDVEERALARALRTVDGDMSLQDITAKVQDFRKERRGNDAEGPSRFAVGRLLDGSAWGVPDENCEKRGPKMKLSEREVKKLIATLKKLQRTRKGEIPVRMILFRAGLHSRVSLRSGVRYLNREGYFWYRPRHKPELTADDMRLREAFADTWMKKRKAFWSTSCAFIDCKVYTAYTTAQAKNYSYSTRVRGIYRPPGAGLDPKYTTPSPLKHRRGVGKGDTSRNYMAVVANGRIRRFIHVEGKWKTDTWIALLEGRVKTAVRASGATHVFRDGDPHAFNTYRGRAAESAFEWTTVQLTPRSPDLMPLDYALWTEIQRRMRECELAKLEDDETWHETPAQFWARLERTALGLDKATVDKCTAHMRKRLAALKDAKGAHIDLD